MAVKNRRAAKRVGKNPCLICGWDAGRRHAAHIIDEFKGQGDGDWNLIPLCPNCATVFDEVLRPRLYKALKEYWKVSKTKELPPSWRKDNKISEVIE